MNRPPAQIRQLYRQRFGIESSYRQMNQARIRTCTRLPELRLLYVGIALVLRNVWVWVHYELFADIRGDEVLLHLEELRFRQLLHWITRALEAALVPNDPYTTSDLPPPRLNTHNPKQDFGSTDFTFVIAWLLASPQTPWILSPPRAGK